MRDGLDGIIPCLRNQCYISTTIALVSLILNRLGIPMAGIELACYNSGMAVRAQKFRKALFGTQFQFSC